MQTLTSLYEFYNKDIPFDIDVIKQAYADASISIHFLYLTRSASRPEVLKWSTAWVTLPNKILYLSCFNRCAAC